MVENAQVEAQARSLVGNSGAIQVIQRLVKSFSKTAKNVLIQGEPGTGKELVASLIHSDSRWASTPLATFPGNTSWEGPGSGQTLLIREIGELPLPVQGRAIRFLQEKGPDVKVIATTSRDLNAAVSEGRFLAGLLQLVREEALALPPLRERSSDIIPLTNHFVDLFGVQTSKPIRRISTPALEMLLSYSWPGNVLELENAVERAVLLSEDGTLHGFHFPLAVQTSMQTSFRNGGRLQERLDSLEYEMLVDALRTTRGNMTQAARDLGLTKRIMGLRLQKFDLDYRKFRKSG